MAWTKKNGRTGPVMLSTDGNARATQIGPKMVMLHVRDAPKGQRTDMFESFGDAQEAYDTGDRSKGMKAKRSAGGL